ncbi:MAG: hypothetical protein KA296_13695 [Marinobacter sp.]|nr:hypothetical protein [Marinobacter sp.]
MSEATNPYESLHTRLVEQFDRLQELLREKSECLETVQQSKFPTTQLPKIMQALQSQHEWELSMTEALGQMIEVVGVAVDEVEADGAPA